MTFLLIITNNICIILIRVEFLPEKISFYQDMVKNSYLLVKTIVTIGKNHYV